METLRTPTEGESLATTRNKGQHPDKIAVATPTNGWDAIESTTADASMATAGWPRSKGEDP